jgi:hypothetical protein
MRLRILKGGAFVLESARGAVQLSRKEVQELGRVLANYRSEIEPSLRSSMPLEDRVAGVTVENAPAVGDLHLRLRCPHLEQTFVLSLERAEALYRKLALKITVIKTATTANHH